jgi:predicted component of type VI protein secretion system
VNKYHANILVKFYRIIPSYGLVYIIFDVGKEDIKDFLADSHHLTEVFSVSHYFQRFTHSQSIKLILPIHDCSPCILIQCHYI